MFPDGTMRKRGRGVPARQGSTSEIISLPSDFPESWTQSRKRSGLCPYFGLGEKYGHNRGHRAKNFPSKSFISSSIACLLEGFLIPRSQVRILPGATPQNPLK